MSCVVVVLNLACTFFATAKLLHKTTFVVPGVSANESVLIPWRGTISAKQIVPGDPTGRITRRLE